MIRGAAAGLALCTLSFSLAAAPEHFAIDPARTTTAFEVSRFALPALHGRFAHVTGSISLDREARSGAIAIEIDATSATIGYGWFDPELKGEDFFDVARHPRLTYRAERMEFDGDRPVRAAGTLTLRGATHPVILELQKFDCAPRDAVARIHCNAAILARISRATFGMTAYSHFIKDEVRLMIDVDAVKQAPKAAPGG